MSLKQAIIAVFSAGCLIGLLIVVPSVGYAQEPKVKNAMETLKSKAAKLGGHPRSKEQIPLRASRCPPSTSAQQSRTTTLPLLTRS